MINETIKVLYVISSLGGGGAESQLCTFVSNAGKHGIEPVVCVLKNSGVMINRFDSAKVKYTILNTRNPIKHILNIAKLAKQEKAKLIHAHMYYSGMMARIAGLFCKSKIVITEHGLGIWKSLTMIMADVLTDFLVDKYIAVSEASRKIRMKREKRKDYKIVTIPNGIDKQLLCQEPPDFDNGELIVGCVARLIPVKRLDILIDAFASLCNEFNNIRLEIVGDGPELAGLKELCEHHNITHKVSFLGWRDDVNKIMQTWKLFVLTSEREDCPVSVLEAMAAGLPCIVSNVGGNSEIVDRHCGRVFELTEIQSLVSAIKELIFSPILLKSMSENCRKKVAEQYLIDVIIEKNIRVYQDL